MKEAKIIKINNNYITATINSDSMCAHCQSSKNCMVKECSKKSIIINNNQAQQYKVGQTINIDIDDKHSFLALFFAYGLPLIILLTTFYTSKTYNIKEINCGIYAIISLIPYYFLLFLNKEKLSNKIEITINDNN